MGVSTVQKKHKENGKEHNPPTLDRGRKRETEKIVSALNQLLANYSVHYQKLRNYHWNVKGENFFDLHEQFELQYNEAKMNIDEIAERIRVFDMTPLSTMEDYLRLSEIIETGPDISSDEMVKEVMNDYRVLLNHMNKVVETAAASDDSGTEEMIKRFIKRIEKHHWMLSAFSSM